MELTLSVDGVLATQASGRGYRISATIPPRSESGAVVQMRIANPAGRRPERAGRGRGVIVGRVFLETEDGEPFAVPARTLAFGALASGLYAAAGAIALLPVWGALALGFGAAAVHTWLLLVQGAFLGSYASALITPGVAALVICSLFRLGSTFKPLTFGRPGAAWAVATVVAVTALKMAFFLHPALPPDDATYHAGRAARVMQGEFFFTSRTPPPGFEIPYPIALYVVAAPAWNVVTDHEALLRVLTLAAEAAAALALFGLVRRYRDDVAAAVWSALLLAVMPIGMLRLSVGSLTNNFGQALLVCGIGLLLTDERRGSRPGTLSVALLAAAFLSHFGTLLMGLPLLASIVSVGYRFGDTEAQRRGKLVAGASLVALLVAFALYYVRFYDVVLETVARVLDGRVSSVPGVMDAPPARKLSRTLAEVAQGYGFVLPLAAYGAVRLVRDRCRDVLSLTLWCWVATTAAFVLLGILTPIEIRSLLSGAPAVAMLAGSGFAVWGGGGLASRLVLAVVFAATLVAQGALLTGFLAA